MGISFFILINAILYLSMVLALILFLWVSKVLCKVEDRLESVETLFDHITSERAQQTKMKIKEFRTEFKEV